MKEILGKALIALTLIAASTPALLVFLAMDKEHMQMTGVLVGVLLISVLAQVTGGGTKSG